MRRVFWGLGALALLTVAAFGGLVALLGLDSLTPRANSGPWIFWFVVLVVAPLSAVGFCIHKAFEPRPK
ncbi:MAG TPA: hypothetical protein VKA46_34240 [Gemmataceae bacterium]|nr:hypothetical protein [Gemmataceae bacterium]